MNMLRQYPYRVIVVLVFCLLYSVALPAQVPSREILVRGASSRINTRSSETPKSISKVLAAPRNTSRGFAAENAVQQATSTARQQTPSPRMTLGRKISRNSSQGTSPAMFLTAPTYPAGGSGSTAMAVIDVNGDGRPDSVVASSAVTLLGGYPGLSVSLGNADGTFDQPVSYQLGSSLPPSSLWVGYLSSSASAFPDAVVATPCADAFCVTGSVTVFLHASDFAYQGFILGATYVTGPGTNSVALADIDGDGNGDIAASNADGTVSVLLGNGDGSFQPVVTYSSGAGVGASAVSVAAYPSLLAVANSSNFGSSVGILLWNGNGFQPASTYATEGVPTSVAIADLNNDGLPDVIVTNGGYEGSGGGTIGVLLATTFGAFQPVVSYSSGGSGTISVAVADVNGDGVPDLIAGNHDSNSVSLLLGNGDGTFQPALSYSSAGLNPVAVAARTTPGVRQASPDVLVLNACSDSVCSLSDIGVLHNSGGASFQAARAYDLLIPSQADAVAVGDLDGDGNPDIVVAGGLGFDGDGSVTILLGNGDGTFRVVPQYDSGGVTATSLSLADINGDGLLDIEVANQCTDASCTSGGVSVLLNLGGGLFSPATSYGSGGLSAESVTTDGLDLFLANQCSDSSCTTGSLGVLTGDGTGSFQPAVSYSSGGFHASSLAYGTDSGGIAIANALSDSMSASGSIGLFDDPIYGIFQLTGILDGNGGQTLSIALGDLNGDGSPDVVVANTNGSVTVWNNDRKTSFTFAIPPSNLTLQSLALEDFNGDGKLDVASGASNTLLLGNGDLTLQSPIVLGAVGGGIAAGDFNHDGQMDLAVTTGSSVTVLLNTTTAVNRGTTTVLASSANPSAFNQSVTFTATVSPSGSGTPTGTVTFKDGSTLLGTGTLNNGAATFSASNLAVGSHTITAAYGGDSNFDPSTSPVLTQSVQQASTTMTVASDLNPSSFNQVVTFTATVTPQFGGQVMGTVTFMDGVTSLGSLSVVGNSAALSTGILTVGMHSISAIYSGDSSFGGSSSSALSQIVNPTMTTTGLISSPNPAAVGQTIVLTATVAGQSGGVPTGTVTFATAVKTLGTAVVTNGVAAVNTDFGSPGTRPITATYSGDANFGTSTSTALEQAVVKAGTGISLAASPNPSTVGQTVAFTSTVVGQFGGKPTGTVTYKDGFNTLGTIKLSGGVAQFSTSSLLRGKHKITTSYGGDANFKASSTSLTQVVR